MIQFERWSLRLVGAALRSGATRYPQFLELVEITPTALIGRLEGLVASGLMTYRRGNGARDGEYTLTEKGRDLEPVLAALDEWGERWTLDAPPAELTLVPTGEPVERDVTDPAEITISMLGSFALSIRGEAVPGLSTGSQRLLVFLALHDREVTRSAVAGGMWPDVSEVKAGISLRSALSRLDPATKDAILVASAGLSLDVAVGVDLYEARLLAQRILEQQPTADDLSRDAIATLSQELLPDWFDDWVVSEAEDWRQLRVNALESLALLLIREDRLGEAAGAARAAIRVDPLRESGYAALISVHLAQGNQSEALQVFNRYSELLSTALGLEPTGHLSDLIEPIRREA